MPNTTHPVDRHHRIHKRRIPVPEFRVTHDGIKTCEEPECAVAAKVAIEIGDIGVIDVVAWSREVVQASNYAVRIEIVRVSEMDVAEVACWKGLGTVIELVVGQCIVEHGTALMIMAVDHGTDGAVGQREL